MNRAVFTVDECLLEMVNVEKTLSGLLSASACFKLFLKR